MLDCEWSDHVLKTTGTLSFGHKIDYRIVIPQSRKIIDKNAIFTPNSCNIFTYLLSIRGKKKVHSFIHQNTFKGC